MEDSKIRCEEVQDLVPAFVDGESADRAPAIRRHLIDCSSCRSVVQEANALRGWFEPTDEVAVPAGFAERVAGAAFAEAGASEGTLVPFRGASAGAREERGRLVDFAVMLTAVAAAALIVVTLLLASDGRGGVDADASMQADTGLTQQLEELERLNALESDAAGGSSGAGGGDAR